MMDGISTPQEGMAVAQQRLVRSAQRIASMVPQTTGPAESLAATSTQTAEAAPASYVPPLQGPPVALLRQDVNLVQETVSQVQAINAFKANATVFREIAEVESSVSELGPAPTPYEFEG